MSSSSNVPKLKGGNVKMKLNESDYPQCGVLGIQERASRVYCGYNMDCAGEADSFFVERVEIVSSHYKKKGGEK